METLEHWLPVEGYEGLYEVSDTGFVRRIAPGSFTRVGRVLSAAPYGPKGYCMVVLNTPGGRPRQFRTHRLVATAFLGPPPSPQFEVNHKDGIKTNNAASNLEWVSHTDNLSHARKMGLIGWRNNGRPCPTCGHTDP